MSNDAVFATKKFHSLRYPSAWPRPRYELGDRVWVGQSEGIIIGLTYVDPGRANDAYESPLDSGWWFEVQYPKNSLIESMGIHEDAIHPVVGVVGGATQALGDCNTPSHPPKDRPRKFRVFLCTTKTNMGCWWFYA